MVNISEAKKNLSQLIRSAQSGEEVVIAKRGKPVARLVAAKPAGDDQGRGSAETILSWLKNNPLPEHARRSRDEIDAGIIRERGSW